MSWVMTYECIKLNITGYVCFGFGQGPVTPKCSCRSLYCNDASFLGPRKSESSFLWNLGSKMFHRANGGAVDINLKFVSVFPPLGVRGRDPMYRISPRCAVQLYVAEHCS